MSRVKCRLFYETIDQAFIWNGGFIMPETYYKRKELTKEGKLIDAVLNDYARVIARDYKSGRIDLTEFDRKKVRLKMALGALEQKLGID